MILLSVAVGKVKNLDQVAVHGDFDRQQLHSYHHLDLFANHGCGLLWGVLHVSSHENDVFNSVCFR